MKKSYLIIGLVALFAIFLYSSFKNTNNKLVTLDEGVKGSWSQVENAYQRRSDLIPNLVSTVRGAADFERGTLTDVIEARSKATSVTIDPSNITPESFAKFQEAQDGLSSALSRLMVSVERYPELKTNQNFLELQSQLEGTENRISVERKKFNETVSTYNTYVRSFPTSLWAGILGHSAKEYFKAVSGAETAPKVEF